MIGELVGAGCAPAKLLGMPIGEGIVGGFSMSIKTEPALVGVFTGAPLDQGGFADPRIVIVLADVAEGIIVRCIKRFGIAFRKENQIAIGQRADATLGSESRKGSLDCVAGGFVGEHG